MSDFLTRMIERTTGNFTGVKPATAPFYASALHSGASTQLASAFFTSGPAPFKAGTDLAEERPGTASHRARSISHFRPLTADRLLDSSTAPTAAHDGKLRHEQTVRAEPAAGEEPWRGGAAVSPERGEPKGEGEAIVKQPAALRAQTAPDDAYGAAGEVPPRAVSREEVGEPRRVAANTGSIRNAEGEDIRRQRPFGSSSQKGGVPAPAAGPPSRSSAQGNVTAEPAQTQTIKVTIGRIEVRAVQQAPVAKPAPAGPAISLDAYLKKQRGD